MCEAHGLWSVHASKEDVVLSNAMHIVGEVLQEEVSFDFGGRDTISLAAWI